MASDTSAFARAVAGERDVATTALRAALRENSVRFAPVVVTELLSNPAMTAGGRRLVLSIPMLPIHEGYWERAGVLRAEISRLGLRANIADTLIAQSCIDHDLPLITYDRDFRHFERAGLRLL